MCIFVGYRDAGSKSGYRRKKFPPSRKVGWAKNLYTFRKILTVCCRMTWAWAERVTLYNRQIIISTTERDRNICKIFGPQTPSGSPGTGEFYRLSLSRRYFRGIFSFTKKVLSLLQCHEQVKKYLYLFICNPCFDGVA